MARTVSVCCAVPGEMGDTPKILITIFGLIALLVSAELYNVFKAPPETEIPVAKCASLIHGCRIVLSKKLVEVKFSALPSALKPLDLTVQTDGVKQVYASFVMVGMEMGVNRYRLINTGNNSWHAKVILPVCVAGRRDWVLTLVLDNSAVQIPFSAGK